MQDIRFEVTDRIAVLSDNGKGYTLEMNMVSFGDYKPKLDLRKWHDGQPMKGIQLTEEEARGLMAALQKHFEGDENK